MNQSYEPSPDEIRQACHQIRKSWTPAERMASLERVPPMQESDFVLVEALAELAIEARLTNRRDALAG